MMELFERNRLAKLSAVVLSVLVAATASAGTPTGVSSSVITITATNDQGTGTFIIYDYDCVHVSGSDVWTYAKPGVDDGGTLVPVTDPNNGNMIFEVDALSLLADIDPVVNLGFTLIAGNSTTTFLVQSALVSFSPMTNPQAKASASITATDAFPTVGGALANKMLSAAGIYRADYNGFVPGGSLFTELVPSVSTPFAGSNTVPGNYGFVTIPGTVSDMSAQVHFTLTPRDRATGTSDYRITPEPSALALLALGALALRRR